MDVYGDEYGEPPPSGENMKPSSDVLLAAQTTLERHHRVPNGRANHAPPPPENGVLAYDNFSYNPDVTLQAINIQNTTDI